MAGSHSITPPKVKPSKASKRFTLEHANKTLPYVRRVVADIVKANEQAEELQELIEKSTDTRKQSVYQTELDGRMVRLSELVTELSDVGVEIKDYRMGLIDFIARHQGRDVYLCWKLGEDKITHWHEISAGFGGRQPIAALEETV